MLDLRIFDDAQKLGMEAALCGAETIRKAITQKGRAVIVLATGSNQIAMLESLVKMPDIDWSVVTAFHLDEYIDLSVTHNASFRHYLRERFMKPLEQFLKSGNRFSDKNCGENKELEHSVGPSGTKNALERLPKTVNQFSDKNGGKDKINQPILHEINGEADPACEIARLNQLILHEEIDLLFAGIGDNCHLAFNDPPADFEAKSPYLLVELDKTCRQQQVDGGWFLDLNHVPTRAISMSINQIMKAQRIIVQARGARKAQAIWHALQGTVDNDYPASILQHHPDTIWFLDQSAAAKIFDNQVLVVNKCT